MQTKLYYETILHFPVKNLKMIIKIIYSLTLLIKRRLKIKSNELICCIFNIVGVGVTSIRGGKLSTIPTFIYEKFSGPQVHTLKKLLCRHIL